MTEDSTESHDTPRVVVVSDLHVGSTVGLWPKGQAIQDGGVVELNKFQVWLHRCWQDCIYQVSQMNRPVLVINGDTIQGAHANRDGQLMTNMVSIQAEAAERLLKPLVALCSRTFIIRGTEFHDGKSAEDVERLAAALGAVQDPETGHHTRWELYLDVGGAVINIAHSIGTTSVPHYEATIPTRELLMLLAELARFYGNKAPNVRMMIRSHRHRYVQVHVPPDLGAVVCPGWQLRTAFAYKKATAMLPEIGWLEIAMSDGRLIAWPHMYPLPKPRIEVM